MKLHPLVLTLIFSSLALGETTPWWEQDPGYASTGGFHGNLNGGKTVGTAGVNQGLNQKGYVNQLGTRTDKAAQLKPDGTYETEAERLIRLSQLNPDAAPDPRKEVVPEAGNLNSPGKLGLDEKLTDAANLAETGRTAEIAQFFGLLTAGSNITTVCAGDKQCYDDEIAKIEHQRGVYLHNRTALGQSREQYAQGARKLTRDYHKLEAKGPTGGGQAGSLSSKSVTYQDDAKTKAAIEKGVESLPEETLAYFRERNIDVNDFAEKFILGDFESAEEWASALKLNESSSVATGGSVGTRPETEIAENISEDRVNADSGNVDRGPVLNIKNGSIVSFGKKKNADGSAAGDDSTSLMTALANFVNGQGKARTGRGAEEEEEVTERDRRALLNFVASWWKKAEEIDSTVPKAARRRTIFDIASESYGQFRGERAVRRGPVAYNGR